jgi:hypothetical protein
MREKIRAELIEEKRAAQLANIHLSDNRAPVQVTAPIPTPPTRAVAPIATAMTSTSTPAHVLIPHPSHSCYRFRIRTGRIILLRRTN